MNINFTNYGQLRDVNATPEESEIFETIKRITGADDLHLVKRSDNYVTAAVGDWDLARFKFTKRAKWINLPIIEAGSEKHRITAPADVDGFADDLRKSLEHVRAFDK